MSHLMDPVSAMHRANQAFHGQVLSSAPLTCGIAHFSAEYGQIANQMREVTIPPGSSMDAVYAEVQVFFSRLPHPCQRWSPAPGGPTEEIERYLTGRGYVAQRRLIMALRPWPDLPSRPPVRVLPGRPMRKALREFLLSNAGRGSPDRRELSTDILLARMDDPQFDVLLAMSEGQPVGHACLLQTGPIAAIYDVYVRENSRRQGYALALMHDLITTCRRLELRNVVLEVDEKNPAAIGLYERCGFERAGTTVNYFLQQEDPS